MARLAAALKDLNARLRGVDEDISDINLQDPHVLMSGASFTMDTDAGLLDFLNEVPGGTDYDVMRARTRQANAGGVFAWVLATKICFE